MNLKAAYKYQLADNKKAIAIYYGVILAVVLFLGVGLANLNTSGTVSLGGFDMATAIFLFIAGLCSFREPFWMLLQNGASRKSVFQSRLLVALTVVFVMAAIDKVILLLGKAIAVGAGNVSVFSIYEQLYKTVTTQGSSFLLHLNLFVYDLCMYFMFFALGYLITILFYRLNKAGKIAVGAGVPIFFCVIYPIFDYMFFDSRISQAFARLFDLAFGISAANPYAAMLSFVVLSAIFSSLSWLLMRRAVVKA